MNNLIRALGEDLFIDLKYGPLSLALTGVDSCELHQGILRLYARKRTAEYIEYIPKGSIYCPLKDSGSKHHPRYGFWNQSNLLSGMWTLQNCLFEEYATWTRVLVATVEHLLTLFAATVRRRNGHRDEQRALSSPPKMGTRFHHTLTPEDLCNRDSGLRVPQITGFWDPCRVRKA